MVHTKCKITKNRHMALKCQTFPEKYHDPTGKKVIFLGIGRTESSGFPELKQRFFSCPNTSRAFQNQLICFARTKFGCHGQEVNGNTLMGKNNYVA
ncbi:hypothetical protein TNCT_662021 [Trichonephila clavata]|uniref:Uncharacterized protein n=1 Tax=Trichonephila clavata TaxID=2740835 RepID=A0A8X6K5N4_TRICU|nr:hypothetical protein TNCT_662021 [Trichonephila clavata]